MQKTVLREIIDGKKLQRLQDEFCAVTGVYAYCLDAGQGQVTELSGAMEQREQVQAYLNSPQLQSALNRVSEGALEDLAFERLGDVGEVAAAAVRVEGATVLYWVVFRLHMGGQTQEVPFAAVLDFLQDVSVALFSHKLSYLSAEMDNRKSHYVQEAMSRTLHSIEATTAIVQLLDNDDQIELVLEEWVRILGRHLEVDTAQVFQLHSDKKTMDVVCEWCEKGEISFFDKTRQVPSYPFLYTDAPLIFSTPENGEERPEALSALNLKALMLFPVIKMENNTDGMILSLNYRQQAHTWAMPEIRFATDAVKVLQSILTRRIDKNSLVSSYAVLDAALDNAGGCVYITDKATGRELFANRKMKDTFAAELRKKTFLELLTREMPEDRGSGRYEVFFEQRERWYDLLYKEIAWVDGSPAEMYSLYDITDKKLYQKKIEQQAYTDFLTGLYNRMCCERDLAKQIDEAKKDHLQGALLYLDLDDFKHINDGLGHQYGDVLLKSISHALRRVEGIENTCYRMGGDEFVIVVPPDAYPRFESIIEDIHDIFNKPWYLKETEYYCTMSMGIVTFPDAGDSVPELIKKADIAMYEAKKTGKNRMARYSDSLDTVSGRRLDMEKNMRDATAEGYKEFEVYYQPIINVRAGNGSCAGAEALIRWNSENLGFISPAEFIPLAEYLGLINPIGNYVLEQACIACRKWNDNGCPDAKVNVNLSVVQLLQTDIVEIVERTIQNTGIQPEHLTLEVTESLAINDMERMKGILNRIKALGVKIALDDFGTGYSSLNHIREIPFDLIKVDQSFVKELAEDAYSQSFIKMVAELAETIGVEVCVEGIETSAQYKVLQNMKVKYIQGYYFDRPMPREQFEQKYVGCMTQGGEK